MDLTNKKMHQKTKIKNLFTIVEDSQELSELKDLNERNELSRSINIPKFKSHNKKNKNATKFKQYDKKYFALKSDRYLSPEIKKIGFLNKNLDSEEIKTPGSPKIEFNSPRNNESYNNKSKNKILLQDKGFDSPQIFLTKSNKEIKTQINSFSNLYHSYSEKKINTSQEMKDSNMIKLFEKNEDKINNKKESSENNESNNSEKSQRRGSNRLKDFVDYRVSKNDSTGFENVALQAMYQIKKSKYEKQIKKKKSQKKNIFLSSSRLVTDMLRMVKMNKKHFQKSGINNKEESSINSSTGHGSLDTYRVINQALKTPTNPKENLIFILLLITTTVGLIGFLFGYAYWFRNFNIINTRIYNFFFATYSLYSSTKFCLLSTLENGIMPYKANIMNPSYILFSDKKLEVNYIFELVKISRKDYIDNLQNWNDYIYKNDLNVLNNKEIYGNNIKIEKYVDLQKGEFNQNINFLLNQFYDHLIHCNHEALSISLNTLGIEQEINNHGHSHNSMPHDDTHGIWDVKTWDKTEIHYGDGFLYIFSNMANSFLPSLKDILDYTYIDLIEKKVSFVVSLILIISILGIIFFLLSFTMIIFILRRISQLLQDKLCIYRYLNYNEVDFMKKINSRTRRIIISEKYNEKALLIFYKSDRLKIEEEALEIRLKESRKIKKINFIKSSPGIKKVYQALFCFALLIIIFFIQMIIYYFLGNNLNKMRQYSMDLVKAQIGTQNHYLNIFYLGLFSNRFNISNSEPNLDKFDNYFSKMTNMILKDSNYMEQILGNEFENYKKLINEDFCEILKKKKENNDEILFNWDSSKIIEICNEFGESSSKTGIRNYLYYKNNFLEKLGREKIMINNNFNRFKPFNLEKDYIQNKFYSKEFYELRIYQMTVEMVFENELDKIFKRREEFLFNTLIIYIYTFCGIYSFVLLIFLIWMVLFNLGRINKDRKVCLESCKIIHPEVVISNAYLITKFRKFFEGLMISRN